MDVYGIEALLGLPACRVVNQVIRPQRLDVHLQRRDTSLVCPRCQTCCSHVKESRPRCLRDLPILERPVLLWLHLRRFECHECHHRPWETSETFGARVKWTERLYHQVRAEVLGGVRAASWPGAMGSPRALCSAGPLSAVGVDVLAGSGASAGLMHTPGARDTGTTPRLSTWTKGVRLPRARDDAPRRSSPGSSIVRKPNSTELQSWCSICPRHTRRPSKSSLGRRCTSSIASM